VRISGFHVDGFGALADFGIDDVSPGLVVLAGPNEAGKSTLLDFFTAMLFGFPTRRDNPRFRAPVRGGRHGGWLTLREASPDKAGGGRWRIERYASPRRELAVTRPDGAPASEDELQRALGGADEALFRAVFAVDLTDLGSTEAMTTDEVRELLFSASIVGQRRSAARAMANLQKQRLELARSRRADAPANRLLAELEGVRHDLVEARRRAAAHVARHDELVAFERQITECRDQADRIDQRTRELDLLARLWDVLERKRAAERQLGSSEEPAPLADWLQERAAELQSLRSACSGHLQRSKHLAELRNQRDGIEQSIRTALGSLGPSWDRGRVRDSEGWIGLADEARHYRSSLAVSESHWRAASIQAEQADASPEVAGLAGDPAETAASATTDPMLGVEDRARAVSELRRNLAEQRRLTAERLARGRRGPVPGPGASRTGAWIAFVASVIVVLGVFAAVVSDVLAVRILCGGLAATGLGLLAVVHLSRRALVVGSGPDDGEIEAALAHVASRVVELARSLGLPEAPSDSDLETVAEAIEAARNRERSRADAESRALAALSRQKLAREACARASEELEAEQVAFLGWKLAHGLEATLSPDGVLESVDALQKAWSHLAALDRVDATLLELATEISVFEARVRELAVEFRGLGGHLEPDETDQSGMLEQLCSSLEQVREVRTTRASLLRAIEDAANELDRSLGRGARAHGLLAELEGGDVLGWNEEQEALGRARAGARQNLEQLVRVHQDAAKELSDLERSACIAELEQRRLALEHELDEVLRSWALLGCARLLLEQTLRHHEQERQPAVLARAAERFAKVTEGRYMSLLPSIGDDGSREAIRVVSSSGAELDASALSRGSIEQLYLCLRIGLAETFAERAEALPLILDDVLVNFDPARAAAVAEIIAETAERHQVLLFTCHPHLSELVRRTAPQAQFVELNQI